jgi:hypothetical protein
VILIDAANVIGSRPTGWWRDRPGAARTFIEQVRTAVTAAQLQAPVVVVLEGKTRAGAPAGDCDGVTIVHAAGSGDDAMVDVISDAADAVTLVTADRGLRQRAEDLGAEVVGPSWLYDQLE